MRIKIEHEADGWDDYDRDMYNKCKDSILEILESHPNNIHIGNCILASPRFGDEDVYGFYIKQVFMWKNNLMVYVHEDKDYVYPE